MVTLPGTEPLNLDADWAARMVAGIGEYLDRALARALDVPVPPLTGEEDGRRRRRLLARAIGAVDERAAPARLERVATLSAPSLVARDGDLEVHEVRWPTLEGVCGEGLLLVPAGPVRGVVIALPDADCTPEDFLGLGGAASAAALPWAAAGEGYAVVVPALVDRDDEWSGNPRVRLTNQPHREYVCRMAFQVGRHILGYEVQRVRALVDALGGETVTAGVPVGVYGHGEGGLVALCAAALDTRLAAAGVSGYFAASRRVWQAPLYRHVWGLLRGLDDAHLAALVAPRTLVVEACPGPQVAGPPPPREGRRGAAPGAIVPLPPDEVRAEVERARPAFAALGVRERLVFVAPGGAGEGPGAPPALSAFLSALAGGPAASRGAAARGAPRPGPSPVRPTDPRGRRRRQFRELCEFSQRLARGSAAVREAGFWQRADTSSPDAWDRSCEPHRRAFWDEVIGRLDRASVGAARPRSRRVLQAPDWTGYEVVLDLGEGLLAAGVLLLPRDLADGERRPAVVCQHGLEGRPRDTVDGDPHGPYRRFAARLAERGYVVYAPQNPYVGGEAFRSLQRKAHPLGWSLFSFILAQHEATLDWLSGLPWVDPQRIGFYGLSYGGKTAMRVVPLLRRYAVCVCSGDFNEWIVKTTSEDLPMSYMFTEEYEILEFDLAHRYNYAELAGLVAPRPFLVERGHHDGVALDEWVAFEYAKVRRLYADLGIPERTGIAFFPGGHFVHGEEAFAFLDRHLGPARRAARDREA